MHDETTTVHDVDESTAENQTNRSLDAPFGDAGADLFDGADGGPLTVERVVLDPDSGDDDETGISIRGRFERFDGSELDSVTGEALALDGLVFEPKMELGDEHTTVDEVVLESDAESGTDASVSIEGRIDGAGSTFDELETEELALDRLVITPDE